MRNTTRHRNNRMRLQKIAKQLRAKAKQEKRQRRAAARAAKPSASGTKG
jgi:hypothetical protein